MPDDESDLIMPWGEHKGKPICDIDSDYLRWLARDCYDEEIAEAADTEYDFREKYKLHVWKD